MAALSQYHKYLFSPVALVNMLRITVGTAGSVTIMAPTPYNHDRSRVAPMSDIRYESFSKLLSFTLYKGVSSKSVISGLPWKRLRDVQKNDTLLLHAFVPCVC